MADMRQCDVCGALEAAGEPVIGSGYLQVVTRATERDSFFAFAGGRGVPHDTYHLCVDCTRTFVAHMKAALEMRR